MLTSAKKEPRSRELNSTDAQESYLYLFEIGVNLSASIKYLHTVVSGRGRFEKKGRQRKFEKNA